MYLQMGICIKITQGSKIEITKQNNPKKIIIHKKLSLNLLFLCEFCCPRKELHQVLKSQGSIITFGCPRFPQAPKRFSFTVLNMKPVLSFPQTAKCPPFLVVSPHALSLHSSFPNLIPTVPIFTHLRSACIVYSISPSVSQGEPFVLAPPSIPRAL